MSYIVQESNFRGNLLSMIGSKRNEAVAGLVEPDHKIEGGGWERLEWKETVKDSVTGNVFPIYPTARMFEGEVVEVGIRADRYFFVPEKGDSGWYFAGIPKEKGFGPEEVNWIRKRGCEDEYFNEGVE